MNAKEQEPEVTMSYEAVRESAPDVFERIRLEGRDEGAQAERERIQSIESIKAPGYENLVSENKFKPESTKESISALVVEAQEARREKAQKDLEADGQKASDQSSAVMSGDAEATSQEQVATAMVAGANSKVRK